MDKDKRPGEQDKDKADVEEVVSDCGDVRLRSQFEIVVQERGVLGINIFGPIFEIFECSDEEDDDSGEHEQPEGQS